MCKNATDSCFMRRKSNAGLNRHYAFDRRRDMQPSARSTILLWLCLLLAAWQPNASAAPPLQASLGTATPGGGFPAYGDALLRTVASTDPELKIEARNTKGSLENIPLLEEGQLDFALVQGEAAYEAWNGIGRPPARLAIVAAMYSTPGMFVVNGDSSARGIADLKGRRIAFGAKNSGLVLLARYVLDGIGLDMERDFQAVFLERAGDGPKMLAAGEVDALWGAGRSWPGFVTVANSPRGARFIVPDAVERQRILARHSFLKPLELPAGSFRGQDQVLQSVGSWSFILARPDRNADAAYRLALAMHKGEKLIGSFLPQADESTLANTLKAAPSTALLHPGVMRLLKETGMIRVVP